MRAHVPNSRRESGGPSRPPASNTGMWGGCLVYAVQVLVERHMASLELREETGLGSCKASDIFEEFLSRE